MGDTENGSWGSRELGGYIRREQARKEHEAKPNNPVTLRELFRANWKNIMGCALIGAVAVAGFVWICFHFNVAP